MFKIKPETQKIKERIKAYEEKIKGAHFAIQYHQKCINTYRNEISESEELLIMLREKLK
jgi:hypothetical protein